MSRYLEELDYNSDEDDEYNEEESEWSIEEQRLKLYGREDSDEEEEDVEGVEDLVDRFKSHSMTTSGEQKRIVPKKKKKEDDSNRIIIVQVEEEKSKDEMNWDSVYSKLSNRKLNQMRFTMKDIESHKLHYDKVDTSRFEVSSVESKNSELEEEEEQKQQETQRKKFKVFEQKVIKQTVDLSLGKMAGCAHGSLVYLSGGGKSGRIYSQLVCYELKERKWVDMKENMFNFYRKQGLSDMLFPPATEGHIIFILGEYLIWYDFKNTCMALKNYMELIKPTPSNKIDKNSPPNPVWLNVSVETVTKAVKETTGHSLSKSNNEPKFWSFGGRDTNGTLTNQFVEYNLVRRNFYGRVQNGIIEFSMTKDLANIANPKAIPLPRENHAQCTVGNFVFIFGGNYSQKDKLLNDLHRYDIVAKRWSEIDLTFIPPPMRNHSLCNCIDQYIYLTGGILRGNVISDVIYRYDVKNSEFAVINPGGPSEYVLYGNGVTTPRDLQLPRADHTTLYDQGQLFMIGGMTDYSKRSYCKEVVVLKECSDIGVENSSYIYLKHEFEKQTNGDLNGYDLILKVADRNGGETEYIYVHKCLVSSRSNYFKDLLLGLNEVDIVDGKSIIELTDYHLDTMNIFIRFLYTGDIIIPDTVDTECLQELLNISKMDIDRYEIILSVCDQKRLYLDSSTAVLNQLKHDCSALYQQIEETMDNFIREPCSENNYADVTIQLLDPSSGELLNELRAHKLFICRSNYISTVFSSGMEETTTGVIKFDEISLNGLLSVLKYLYTNEIVVSIEHAVEVFICSLLFQLNELANYCRTIVIQHITVENVLPLSYLVDVYNDLALKNNCIKCISQNFETVSKLDGFEGLSSEIKGEAKTRHFEMVKKLTKMKAKERMKVKK